KARDEPVIAPAPADRAEPRAARIDQLGLEHRAGVVFEATHDRGVLLHAAINMPGRLQYVEYLREFLYGHVGQSVRQHSVVWRHTLPETQNGIWRRVFWRRLRERHDRLDLRECQTRAFREIA